MSGSGSTTIPEQGWLVTMANSPSNRTPSWAPICTQLEAARTSEKLLEFAVEATESFDAITERSQRSVQEFSHGFVTSE